MIRVGACSRPWEEGGEDVELLDGWVSALEEGDRMVVVMLICNGFFADMEKGATCATQGRGNISGLRKILPNILGRVPYFLMNKLCNIKIGK